MCIGYIGLSFVLPQNGERPRWLAESRTLPLVASTTDTLSRLLPDSFRNQAERFHPTQRDSDYLSVLRAYSVPGAKAGGALPSIAPEDQKRLNQLIQQLGGGETEGPGKMIQVPQGR